MKILGGSKTKLSVKILWITKGLGNRNCVHCYWTTCCYVEVHFHGRTFISSKTSRPTLGTTLSLIHCEPASFAGVKRPGREVDHSPPSSTDVNNKWIYTSASHRRFHEMGRDNFTFFVYAVPRFAVACFSQLRCITQKSYVVCAHGLSVCRLGASLWMWIHMRSFRITWYLVIAGACGGRYLCVQEALHVSIVLVLTRSQKRSDDTIHRHCAQYLKQSVFSFIRCFSAFTFHRLDAYSDILKWTKLYTCIVRTQYD
jgi:hypothetical protein